MTEEKQSEKVYYVATKDEFIEVSSSKLKKTLDSILDNGQPCLVYSNKEDLNRVLKFRDRTSFEVRNN